MIKKAYCGGRYCNKFDRKFKCVECHKYMCNLCSLTTSKNKDYCIDCYIKLIENDFDLEFEKLKIEFKEMLSLPKKDKVENVII